MKKYDIVFADLDGTLIDTYTGKTFPQGIWDMELKFDVLDKIKKIRPKYVFIVTNQGGLGKFVQEDDFIAKCTYICKCIEGYCDVISAFTFCGSMDSSNENRKPNCGMLSSLCAAYAISQCSDKKEKMLMIGDASGKPGQFGDSDKKCAENFGIDYYDVDDFIKA